MMEFWRRDGFEQNKQSNGDHELYDGGTKQTDCEDVIFNARVICLGDEKGDVSVISREIMDECCKQDTNEGEDP